MVVKFGNYGRNFVCLSVEESELSIIGKEIKLLLQRALLMKVTLIIITFLRVRRSIIFI